MGGGNERGRGRENVGTGTVHWRFFLSYTSYRLRKKPDIQYPAFRIAGYPAKSVSGAFLNIFIDKIVIK